MVSDSTVTARDEGEAALAHTGLAFEPTLFIVIECGRPLAGGARYSLSRVDEVILGRGPARTAERPHGTGRLVVCIPDRWMSHAHARIFRAGDTWTLEDTGATNGCMVNGERVTRALLADDDVVELGHTIFRLRETLSNPSAAPDCDAAERPARAMGFSTLLPELAVTLEAVERVGATPLPVLLLGETGTGKELVASRLHALSKRTGRFVAVNCGALPDALLESQLFGHVKGAFSGAVGDTLGFVRSAERGTLFLDEIGDLSLRSQAALLRVLQEREVVPVGATHPIAVDVRVLAATHRPLEALCARGEFRSDLYARLVGLRVVLPPLRERREDLGLLVADVLRAVAPARAESLSLSAPAGRAFALYDWPLNIRELHQTLALSVALATSDVVELSHLPAHFTEVRAQQTLAQPPWPLSSEDALLHAELLAQFENARGNVSEVARAMGKARTQIHRWIKRFGIDLGAFRP